MLRPAAFIVLLGCQLGALAAQDTEPANPPAAGTVESGGTGAPAADSSLRGGAGAPGSTPPAAAADDENLLDATREAVHFATEWLVRNIDSWFGDVPFEQGGRVAGRISLRFLWRQDDGVDWLTRFAVRVNPPNLRRLGSYLFLGRDNEREVVSDRPDTFTRRELLLPETREDQSFFAGLGTQLADAISLRAGFRGGLKPYAQARFAKQWEFGDRNRIDFRETLFWTLNDGFGSTTSLTFARLLAPDLALRWESAATWTVEDPGILWGSTFGAYRSFGAQTLLSFEGLLNGQTGVGVGVAEYGLRLRWEQPVYKDWLLAEVLVGYFWPQASESVPRTTSWAFGAGIQMRF